MSSISVFKAEKIDRSETTDISVADASSDCVEGDNTTPQAKQKSSKKFNLKVKEYDQSSKSVRSIIIISVPEELLDKDLNAVRLHLTGIEALEKQYGYLSPFTS